MRRLKGRQARAAAWLRKCCPGADPKAGLQADGALARGRQAGRQAGSRQAGRR